MDDIQQLVNDGKLKEAVFFSKIVAINHLQSAALISSKFDIDESIRLSQMSIDIEPNFSKSHANHSYFLGYAGHIIGAILAIRTAITMDPNVIEYQYSYAALLSSQQKLDEAIEMYRNCLKLDPNMHSAAFNLGCLLYLKGQFREGQKLMESRFDKKSDLHCFRDRFNCPTWDGITDLSDKRLVIYSEQGSGDVINYIRYVPKIKCAYLIGEMQQELIPLVSNFFDLAIGRDGDFDVKESATDIKADYCVSFSSLPYLLDPDLANIPQCPYLHSIGENNFEFPSDKLNVGLIWAGSAFHSNDLNRSCNFKYLKELNIEGVRFYNLQKGNLKREWADLSEGIENFPITDLTDQLTDFNNTAKIIEKLDLLITVDTASAHLAGALGVPVWMMTAFCNDHRWLLNKEDTMWYPSFRMFRQKSYGKWENVIKKIKKELYRHEKRTA